MSREKKTVETKHIGDIGIIAGLCWVGDPVYFWREVDGSPGALERKVGSWDDFKFCLSLNKEKGYTSFGPTGCVVTSGHGNGIYPVYATFEDGIITSITVDFS